MSNKNLRDYIRLVEEITGTEPAGIDWIKSKLPNINLPNIKQMVPGLAEPVKTSDPSLQAHQARVAAQQPAEPVDAQAAKERVVPKKAAPATAKRTVKTSHKTTTKARPKAEPTATKSAKPSTKPSVSAPDSAKKPETSTKKSEPQVAKKVSDPGVAKTQQFLKNLGYDIKLDGIWGPQTEQAYRSAFPNAPSNQREPTGIIRPNSSQQPAPDKFTQGRLDKTGQSADIAAAAGMPNPFIKPQSTGAAPASTSGATNPTSPFYIPPNKALDSARAKAAKDPRYNNLYDPMGVHAGEKSLEESDLNRIKDLVNYKK